MSFTLGCPNCGPRPVAEFRFGGENRPAPQVEPSDEDGMAYLYRRSNRAGLQDEWWFHRFGCRCWFLARRDTRDNRVEACWWPKESPPLASEPAEQSPSRDPHDAELAL